MFSSLAVFLIVQHRFTSDDGVGADTGTRFSDNNRFTSEDFSSSFSDNSNSFSDSNNSPLLQNVRVIDETGSGGSTAAAGDLNLPPLVKTCPEGYELIKVTEGGAYDCKCKKYHLFWPEDGKCYREYTQGPCPTGHR